MINVQHSFIHCLHITTAAQCYCSVWS